jgi:hypothetical protein
VLTVLLLCADLSLRAGRQGSAGVQPEHLAVLGLHNSIRPGRGVSCDPGFLLGAMQAKVQSEKLIFF